MQLERYSLILAATAVLVACAAAGAQAEEKVDNPNPPPVVATGPNCNLMGYEGWTYTAPAPIPIPDAVGVSPPIPPITTVADLTILTDVILGLTFEHTWVGDLVVRLSYDQNNDTIIDASAVAICRPDAVCGGPDGAPFGCGDDLVNGNPYRFSDEAVAEINVWGDFLENTCGQVVIPAACHKPSAAAGLPMSNFDGLMKGGTFSLSISDHAQGDLGLLHGWQVHTKSQGTTAARATSWGKIKTSYR